MNHTGGYGPGWPVAARVSSDMCSHRCPWSHAAWRSRGPVPGPARLPHIAPRAWHGASKVRADGASQGADDRRKVTSVADSTVVAPGLGADPARILPADQPDVFRAAVASLTGTAVRREVRVQPLRPPQRLAPYSYAIAADVVCAADGAELATGRLVLLHDPDGAEAWDGVLRLVTFASAELDEQMGARPDAARRRLELADRRPGRARRRLPRRRAGPSPRPRRPASATSPARRPPSASSCGRRGRSTRRTCAPHLHAFVDLLCAAAGLPPEGVAVLPSGG